MKLTGRRRSWPDRLPRELSWQAALVRWGFLPPKPSTQGVDREECFRTQIGALLEGGVDLIFLETFQDVDELLVALHVKQSLHHCPAICSFAASEDGLLPGSVSLKVAFEKLVRHDAEILGVNCINGAEVALRLVEKLVPSELPLAVYPNASAPGYFHGRYGYDLSPAAFAQMGLALAAKRCSASSVDVAAPRQPTSLL